MALDFEPLNFPADVPNVVEFLTANEWPFHSVHRLSTAAAATVNVTGDDVDAYWVREGGDT